ncbi:MAG: bacillithiol biosynthesis cysteine-adding enzyme BshC [Bacteroidia bacterium]|nr:bacillithiol biosynthesis cysteine-adding enzyme BshC [Bacteroidia bacterium]
MSTFLKTTSFPSAFYTRILSQVYQGKAEVLDLYPNSGPTADWEQQIQNKQDFPQSHRDVLANELLQQYGDLATGFTLEQIQSLKSENTFTVTTGQQIHIFLGPLYVVYKALSTIALANELKQKFPQHHFVPVFWMATEDHDFGEINHVNVFHQQFTWESASGGPVGRIETSEIVALINSIKAAFPSDIKVTQALEVFEIAYTTNHNLAAATRYLLHHYFGEQGLVVIDADSKAFKKEFVAIMQADVLNTKVSEAIERQTVKMKGLGLETNISGRHTHLFMLINGQRLRLDKVELGFQAKGEERVYTQEQVLNLIETEPENFSPNVALRPIYQEVILPNLCYIAGPGEFTYWYQLSGVFEICALPRPVLLPRHSFVVGDAKTQHWLENNGMDMQEMFNSEEDFKKYFFETIAGQSPMPKLIEMQKTLNTQINEYLYSVKSDQLKGVKKAGEGYEMMLKKAEDEILNSLTDNAKYAQIWQKTLKIKEKLFNPNTPQERKSFFLEMLIQNPDFLKAFTNLPDTTNTPLSVLWMP